MMLIEDVMPVTPSRRVLVVEDDPIIRMATAEALRAAGYVVVEAGDARQALDCDDALGPFDVVFTDVRMPGVMDGIALADILRIRRPDTAIVIATGTPALVPAEWRASLVRKPYAFDTLLGCISAAISKAP